MHTGQDGMGDVVAEKRLGKNIETKVLPNTEFFIAKVGKTTSRMWKTIANTNILLQSGVVCQLEMANMLMCGKKTGFKPSE